MPFRPYPYKEGLKRLINIEPDIRVTGESADPAEILQATKDHEYDILILDITLPQKSGLEILKVKVIDPDAGFDFEHAPRRSFCYQIIKSRNMDISQKKVREMKLFWQLKK